MKSPQIIICKKNAQLQGKPVINFSMDFHLVISHQPVGPNQSPLRLMEKPHRTSIQLKEETQLASGWAQADWLIMLEILSLKAEVIMFLYISEKGPLFPPEICYSSCIPY